MSPSALLSERYVGKSRPRASRLSSELPNRPCRSAEVPKQVLLEQCFIKLPLDPLFFMSQQPQLRHLYRSSRPFAVVCMKFHATNSKNDTEGASSVSSLGASMVLKAIRRLYRTLLEGFNRLNGIFMGVERS